MIMSLSDPYMIMNEAKKIKITYEWARDADRYLYKFNKIKFHQPELREHLVSTRGYLYEASFNPIWGAGFHLGQARFCTPKQHEK